jgi:hypothetical protein
LDYEVPCLKFLKFYIEGTAAILRAEKSKVESS